MNITTNIIVQVAVECTVSQCPDAASMTSLYNQMVNNFKTYLSSGLLQTNIRGWANERKPPVPDLFEVQTDATSFNTDGMFDNPLDDPEATVKTLSITTSGQLLTNGLDTSTFTSAQEQQAKVDFENAIMSSLGTSLPQGSTVTVTSLKNGVVNYVIALVGFDSSADATSAATTAVSSLDNSLAGISTSIAQNLPGVAVASNTPGTVIESNVAVVTSSGQLFTSLAGLNTSQKDQVSDYFKSAIGATLREKGVLPEGAYITAKVSDAGVVSYTITMNMDPGADNAIIVHAINSELSLGSTLAVISTRVASNVTATIPAVSTVSILGFTPGKSKGVSFKPWYPNWTSSYCSNDGNSPPFMNKPENMKDYIFTTQAECCKTWFPYASDCVKGLAKPVEKFYPVWSSGGCSKKLSNNFTNWEKGDLYDTLEECCEGKFSSDKPKCCNSPGMGGCGNSRENVFFPDWTKQKCIPRSKDSLTKFELTFAQSTQSICCSTYFKWADASQKQLCLS